MGVVGVRDHSQTDEWEINRSKIEMGQKLGEGLVLYGEVYKGIYLITGQLVAVKTFSRVSKRMGDQ